MCGSARITSTVEAMRRLFRVNTRLHFEPNANLAPTQLAPILRLDGEKRRELALLRWGLIPSWAGDTAIGSKTFNARAETITEKPAFRDAFQRRRCLVPADGFYEWAFVGGRKQPYRFGVKDGGLFAMAGLWERWAPEGKDPIESFTIITTIPNTLVAPIHDRMPVILDPAEYDTWLLAGPSVARSLLRPYPTERMMAEPASHRINKSKTDDAQAMLPL